MLRFTAVILTGVLALAGGCKSEPAQPGKDTSPAPPDGRLTAIEPRSMAEQVALTPTFKWRLPSAVSVPRLVSFTLFEFGQTAEPPKAADEGKKIAFASGLHDVSPTALDPFHPPAGCVVGGDLRDMKQLKGNTWYLWRVRVLGEGEGFHSDFYFRTRTDSEPFVTPNAGP
jgi:hypothetical protein